MPDPTPAYFACPASAVTRTPGPGTLLFQPPGSLPACDTLAEAMASAREHFAAGHAAAPWEWVEYHAHPMDPSPVRCMLEARAPGEAIASAALYKIVRVAPAAPDDDDVRRAMLAASACIRAEAGGPLRSSH